MCVCAHSDMPKSKLRLLNGDQLLLRRSSLSDALQTWQGEDVIEHVLPCSSAAWGRTTTDYTSETPEGLLLMGARGLGGFRAPTPSATPAPLPPSAAPTAEAGCCAPVVASSAEPLGFVLLGC